MRCQKLVVLTAPDPKNKFSITFKNYFSKRSLQVQISFRIKLNYGDNVIIQNNNASIVYQCRSRIILEEPTNMYR
jgi:hypothetical protein